MAKKRCCQWEGCSFDITGYPPNQKYCPVHSKERERERKRKYAKDRYGVNATLDRRIFIDKHGRLKECRSARATKEYYDTWKGLEKLNKYDLEVLYRYAKHECKYGSTPEDIQKLRTLQVLINDASKKVKKIEEDSYVREQLYKKIDRKIYELGLLPELNRFVMKQIEKKIIEIDGIAEEENALEKTISESNPKSLILWLENEFNIKEGLPDQLKLSWEFKKKDILDGFG